MNIKNSLIDHHQKKIRLISLYSFVLILHLLLLHPIAEWMLNTFIKEPPNTALEVSLAPAKLPTQTEELKILNPKEKKKLVWKKEDLQKEVFRSQHQSTSSFLENNQYQEDQQLPEEIVKTIRNQQPEKTKNNQLHYTMSTYQWTFQRYAENWAIDLKKWWRAPTDYLTGKVPQGGKIWIKVRVNLDGSLQEYKIYESNITAEMELRVIQALISSFKLDPLPKEFPEKDLTVYWCFVYPPLYNHVQLNQAR